MPPTFPPGPPGSIYPDLWLGPIAYSQNPVDVDPLVYSPVVSTDTKSDSGGYPLRPITPGTPLHLDGIILLALHGYGNVYPQLNGSLLGLLASGLSVEQAAALVADDLAAVSTPGETGYDCIHTLDNIIDLCFILALDDASTLRVSWGDSALVVYQQGTTLIITSIAEFVDYTDYWAGFIPGISRETAISDLTSHANMDGATVLNAGWSASPGAVQTWITTYIHPEHGSSADWYTAHPYLMTQLMKTVRIAVFPLTPPA